MKRKQLLMKMMLAVALMGVGNMSAWATNSSTFAGTSDNATTWGADTNTWVSKTYTLSGNGTYTFTFYTTNATDEGYRGWNLFVGNSPYSTNLWNTWMICRGFGAAPAAYGTAAGSQTPTYVGTYSGSSIVNAINGATVTLAITRNSTAITAIANVTPTNGDAAFTQTFTYTYDGSDDATTDLYLTFAVDCGYVSISDAMFKEEGATESTATISCASSITMVGTAQYASGDGNGSSNSSTIWLNSNKTWGGAGALSFVLDNNWDVNKVKSAVLRIYPTSKPNANVSGDIYIRELDAFPSVTNNANTVYNSNHTVYSYGGANNKRYSFSSNILATIAGSGYTNYAPKQGAYYDVDITTYIQSLSKNAGESVYFGIDIADWTARIAIGAYHNDNAAQLVITYSDYDQYNYTVKAVCGETELATLASGYDDNGATVNYYFPHYLLYNDELYYKNSKATGSYFGDSFTLSSDNQEVEVEYTKHATITDIVYLEEAENISGLSLVSNNYIVTRASNGSGGRPTSATTITSLEPGKYVLMTASYATASQTYTFTAGDETILTQNAGGWSEGTSSEFTLYTTTDIKVECTAGNHSSYGIDYVLIYKTGEATVSKTISSAGWATYCSPYALDFSSAITNLDAAYIVTGGSDGVLTTEAVTTTVPANTGLLLKGSEGTVTIPVVASSSTSVSSNILTGVTSATAIEAGTGWVLMNDATDGLGFYKNTNAFTVGANTAYILLANLPEPPAARGFYSLFGETTGVSAALVNNETMNNEVYNLQGQRVAAPQKGLYVVNGKKVIIK